MTEFKVCYKFSEADNFVNTLLTLQVVNPNVTMSPSVAFVNETVVFTFEVVGESDSDLISVAASCASAEKVPVDTPFNLGAGVYEVCYWFGGSVFRKNSFTVVSITTISQPFFGLINNPVEITITGQIGRAHV